MNATSATSGRPPLPEGQAATGHIHIRTTLARKNAYVRFARKRGQKLTDAIFEVMDKAAGYELDG